MRIAITGSTGNVGSKVANELFNRGQRDLVLITRSPEKLPVQQRRECKIQHGDLSDMDFVREALAGVDAVFWVIPPNFRAPNLRLYQAEMARIGASAAKINGVKHVVLLSSIGAEQPQGTGPILGLHDAEAVFRAAVPSLTILRPASFMENFLMQLDAMREQSSIFLPVSGQAKAPMIATQDIAKAAADALLGAPPDGTKTVTLAGPKDYTFDEAASIIGQAVGRPMKHVKISDEQASQFLTSQGASPDVAHCLVEMYDAVDHGALKQPQMEDAARTRISLEQFAQDVLKPAILAG